MGYYIQVTASSYLFSPPSLLSPPSLSPSFPSSVSLPLLNYYTEPTFRPKMQAIRMEQRKASRHNATTSGSSESRRATLNAARNGVHETLGEREGGERKGEEREGREREGREREGGEREGGENNVIARKLAHITHHTSPSPPPSHSSTPPHLEHSPDVLCVCGAGEARRLVTHPLHQCFCRLRHLSHLLRVRQTTLLLTHCEGVSV